MLGYFQRVKICCTLAGAAAVLVGQKIAESETVRKTAVDIMAAGIKVVNGATDFVKSVYDEAANKVVDEEKTSAEADKGEETADSVATYADDPATD
ncbi:MAG: hypothetical protein K2K57_09785 [Oscillospiraceae bacterium]|nr:hypothetical protein [Oscillospiraceae bacterium]